MRNTATFLTLLALAVPAIAAETPQRVDPKGEARLAQLIGDRVAGEPVDCITIRQSQQSTVIDGTAIVYGRGSKLYVNRPETGAESLNDDDILLTRLYSSQLCRIDTIRLVDRVTQFQRGFIGLGKFVPYTRPDKPKGG